MTKTKPNSWPSKLEYDFDAPTSTSLECIKRIRTRLEQNIRWLEAVRAHILTIEARVRRIERAKVAIKRPLPDLLQDITRFLDLRTESKRLQEDHFTRIEYRLSVLEKQLSERQTKRQP